jgi:hypothetical protein
VPNPNNRVTKEQWDLCERCGLLWAMSKLIKQKGLMVCPRDIDNLEVERRDQLIMRILGDGISQEGVDTRVYDRSFFQGFDDEVM